MIRQIKFFCKYQNNGCKEAFTSSELKKHEAQCVHG